jgi:hypothetical protein
VFKKPKKILCDYLVQRDTTYENVIHGGAYVNVDSVNECLKNAMMNCLGIARGVAHLHEVRQATPGGPSLN